MNGKRLLSWKAIVPVGLMVVGVLVLATGCTGSGLIDSATPASTSGLLTNSITVIGSGQASGSPDVAYLQLGVDVTDADVGEAVTQANQTMERVRDAIVELGVAPEDIQTASFNVWSEERYNPRTGVPTGERIYRVMNTLNIVVRDMAQTGAVIEAGLGAGANNVGSLSFGIDDTSALEQQARTQAVEDARQRAEQLAEASGVTLGEPTIASEVYGEVSPTYLLGAREAAVATEMAVGAAPPISEGQLSVSVQVTVTFRIAP